MRYLRFGVIILVLVGLVGGSVCSVAAEGATIPTLAPVTSARMDFVTDFNGQPLSVTKIAFQSANRWHWVEHDLVTVKIPEYAVDYQAGGVVEAVYWDGTYYLRFNDDPTWITFADQTYDPNLTFSDFMIANYHRLPEPNVTAVIGAEAIGGLQTTHYQVWSGDRVWNAANCGQLVFDFFVTTNKYLIKSVYNSRGACSLGTGNLGNTMTLSEINQPVIVGPPPAKDVQPARTLHQRGMTRLLRFRSQALNSTHC